MKTRDEMIYDFMLALCSTLTSEEMADADDPDFADVNAEYIFHMAKTLTKTYLESL